MFTWIPFYKELSEKLIEYKDRRDELVRFVYATDGLGHYTNYLHTKDGKTIDDIDPFSFYGIFNTSNKRNAKIENRIDILTRIKEKFCLNSSVPSDFEGVPMLYYAHSFFYDWEDVHNSCELLWRSFLNLMNGDSLDEYFEYYRFGSRKSETTMPLYWIKPDEYVALDYGNRNYLKREYELDALDGINDYTSYKEFCDLLKDRIQNNEIKEQRISEISANAYVKTDKKIEEECELNVWFVRDKDVKQFDLCVNEGCLYFNCDNKLSNMSRLGDTVKSFSESLGETKTIKKTTVNYSYWQLSHEVKEDDIIFYFKKPDELFGWGYVTGSYQYDDTKQYHHSVSVAWNKVEEGTISPVSHNSGLWFKDVSYYDAKPLFRLLGINIEEKKENKEMEYQEYINLLKENHNLILTGAPGTGKTTMVKAIAKEMGAETEFVQFHPSYDYTDFVEGLRPININGQMGFERKDGIFKMFCKRAIYDEVAPDNQLLKKLNSDPKVWKVSLGGANDNPIRTDCLANDCIRIGWSGYGDVEDFNDMQEFKDGGKTILRAFQSEMQIGDIVVSCYSQFETDAIGIIIGDYEYRADGDEFPRYRTVEWIIKDKKINIHEVIGKKMTLSTIYKLNVSITKIIEIIKGNTAMPEASSKVSKPYVMIIDEINRGDLSRIFGELFFAIDPGYRGTKGLVKTQYQNLVEEGDVFDKGFYVPENIYILATMNDIDRSVESMDFAMRRRFTWKEVTPDDTEKMLKDFDCAEEAKATMKRLNDAIKAEDGLGSAYMVGPSYFLKLKNNGGDFKKLWSLNIEPLLREYLRGFRKSEDIMKKFENAYFNVTETKD